jgi:RNA polymerase sigma-70 factor, ECF subfamily
MSFIALITPSAADGDHARPIRPVLARLADLDGRVEVEEGTASGSAARLHMTLESQDLRLQQPSGSEDQVGHDQQKARFDSLVFPHLSDAYALARSVTGNHSDAEDVVQEACLRAFRAIDSVAESKARAWLLTIVYRTACTWLGRNRPSAVVTVADLEMIERTQSTLRERQAETPETALIAKVDGARLQAAIAALPVVYRETLLLRELEGMDYREIAQITGVPIGTVMSRLARARRQVIAMLGKNES